MAEDLLTSLPQSSSGTPTNGQSAIAAGTASTSFYRQLHQRCGEILAQSLQKQREQLQGRAHGFTIELTTWLKALGERPETYLLRSVAKEVQYGLLCLSQGHYSHSFRSLRLVLELGLQTIFLSAHPVELREWLENRKDTVWGEILDDDNGIFSARFTRAFDPELESHRKHYTTLSRTIYRECSECVHGNVPKHIVLPETLEFAEGVFHLWHEKSEVAAMVLTFALYMRYFRELSKENQASLEAILLDRLGHLPEVRKRFGAIGGDP